MYASLPGKKVGQYIYQHTDLAGLNPTDLQASLSEALRIAEAEHTPNFNVIKIRDDGTSITFLDYDSFMEEGFPPLRQYWAIDLASKICRYRSYQNSFNPPVLHRKELLLPKDHCRQTEFKKLTKVAESLGLFDDPSNIGFYQTWCELLKSKGFGVIGNELQPIGNDVADNEPDEVTTSTIVSRHLTALTRSNFSAPIQILQRHGYFSRQKSFFDYGCGKGDDLRGLSESGVNAKGWDPYYAPEGQLINADVVNLGFVINVIEDPEERAEALTNAFKLADQLLVVSVMLKHLEHSRGRNFSDGILTGRGTFQKYYSQEEIIDYIKQTLNEDPIAAAPGVILVFKDKNEEQIYLARRNIRRIKNHTFARRPFNRTPPKQKRLNKQNSIYKSNIHLLTPLWDQWLELGRTPEPDEIDNINEIENKFGTLRKAFNLLLTIKGDEGRKAIKESADRRTEDIKVYLSKLLFQRRRQYKKLEPGIKHDIKAFFGTYLAAEDTAKELLFRIADVEAVWNACMKAAQAGVGWLNDDHSLQVHTSLIPELPALLRCYINCGASLYGDAESADLVKVHIRSGKLTLMEFDDFEGSVLPRMTSRIKIRLRNQTIQYFDYADEYEPPYLYHKSRYINETYQNYSMQCTFEGKLLEICPLISVGHGPSTKELERSLSEKRYKIDRNSLLRTSAASDLDNPCGRYFRFRDLINCGDTFHAGGLSNLPKEPESYNALQDLASNILDPLIDYYGMIELSYGFCSHELSKKIQRRVAPRVDQHAAFERNSKGQLICTRGGAAVDFIVKDEDSFEVAAWMQQNLDFDKMYLYGRNRPIHVSFKNNPAREIYLISETNGNRYPTKVSDLKPYLAL